MSGSSYRAPEVSSKDVTPTFVRDELLKCFESANREFMEVVHQPTTDEALRAQVRQFVTTVFQGCGAMMCRVEGVFRNINQDHLSQSFRFGLNIGYCASFNRK